MTHTIITINRGRKINHSLETILLINGSPDAVCGGSCVARVPLWIKEEVNVFTIHRGIIIQVTKALSSAIVGGPTLKSVY